MQSSRRTVTPTASVIEVADLKAQCRITSTAEDTTVLPKAITDATDMCERECGRSFITQTWVTVLSRFPHGPIYLPRPPLISVSSALYTDEDGVSQALTDYNVDTYGTYGSIWSSEAWPQTQLGNPSSVVITYVCGYGSTAASVPACATRAVLEMAAFLVEYREPIITGTIVAELPYSIRHYLDPIRVLGV